jgi:hypothetical protein
MSEESEALVDQAESLEALANDVEALLSGAKSYITNTMTTWEGPNRNEVEDLLSDYDLDCGTAAEALRTRANNLRTDASELENGNGEGGGE